MAISLPRVLMVCLSGGVFLGLTGPLGTIALPLALRLGYWLVATLGGGLLGWAATFLVMRWPAARAHPWLMIVAIAAVMTPPGALLVYGWGKVALAGTASLGSPLALAGWVFVISLALTAINRLMLPQPAPQAFHLVPDSAPDAAAREPSLAFRSRLPPRLRDAAILAVEAEDHYLRVHTDRGSDLILMRLSDALGELGALDGARTHRSWWVARAAVCDVTRGDGRATLTLQGGLRAPVSRAHAAALHAAGWF